MSVSQTSSIYLDEKLTKKMTALDVARFAPSTRRQRPIRSVNLSNNEISSSRIISSIKGNSLRLYHIENDCGYILECTDDTWIYTKIGFKQVRDIVIGEEIEVNGQPSEKYKEKEWLEEWYVKRGKTQQELADMCSTPSHIVSARTVRAWIKRYGLGRGDSGAMFGEDNPRYKDANHISDKGLYERIRQRERTNVCEICGRKGDTDLHHLDHNLLNTDEKNIVEICEKCHQMLHKGAVIKHTRPAKITMIRMAGVDKVVDLTTESGNYVCEGYIIGCITDEQGCQNKQEE